MPSTMIKIAALSTLALTVAATPVPSKTFAKRAAGCDPTKGHTSGYYGPGDKHEVDSNGAQRYYGMYVPTDYDPNTPLPLIIDYHGHGGNPSTQRDVSQYDTFQPAGFLVAYPAGLGSPSAWEGANYEGNAGADDIQFTLDLITHLEEQYCIDTDRIYASGKSNGAGFVGTLACDARANVFAAFAMSSAALYTDNLSDSARECTPAKGDIPTPVFEVHGSADTTIPYYPADQDYLGGRLPAIPDWLNKWASPDRDNAGAPVSTQELGTTTNHTSYALENGNVVVQGILVDGMSHCWASTKYNADWDKKDSTCIAPFDTTPLFIDFFNKWDVNGPRSS
ncbi:hypothetical protein FH972_021443 [Carpinus fangiana]|uniref:Uncharacterized protein n=1 Tax=Carpinus fangiana TaxID=176857 RepID=A0A5N6KPX7_9ROSI|nr:hypothetical protein FH972_021443 [Carpinus fangiana]